MSKASPPKKQRLHQSRGNARNRIAAGKRSRAMHRSILSRNPTPKPGFDVNTKAYSYKEAILYSILNANSKASKTYEHAATFSRVLLSLTRSTKMLGYSFGEETGKELYKIVSEGKNYYWYEESIPELVSFLEKATGYPVSYQFLHNGLRIRLHSRNALGLGTNIHSFEAGIISGFVTAASRQPVKIREIACTSNGADYCEFIPSAYSSEQEKEIEMEDAVYKFAKHIAPAIKGQQAQNNFVPLVYHALLMQPLLDSRYVEALDIISGYAGLKVAESLFDDKHPNISKIRDYLSKSATLLNFGAPRLKSTGKHDNLNMEFVFKPEISKKEYVEMSLAFINGIVSKASNSKVSFEMKGDGEGYILKMKENK
ncbi:MAG: V4R domain-containing protein [Candidatus Micrarchaeia archaeon]